MKNFVMALLITIAAASLPTAAKGPFYITDLSKSTMSAVSAADVDELRRESDDYARAAHLPVLEDGAHNEYRIWRTWANFNPDTIGYETDGYVVTHEGVQRCEIHYPPNDLKPITAHCKSRSSDSEY